jgi:hypothetical protein
MHQYILSFSPLSIGMRSLTHSSAGVTSPTTVVTCQHIVPVIPHPRPIPCQPSVTPGRPGLVPQADPHAFFDVHNDSLVLSSQAKDHVTQAIQGSWASSTLKRYTGAIRQFILFCDTENVPAHLRFPSDEFVLCAFAASSLGRHAGGTPRSRLSALKAWHAAHNVEWKGSERLNFVMNGVRNSAPGTSKHPPRPPVNARMLSQLVESLDLNSPIDAAIAACAATAFWGQCRLGELLPVSSSPYLAPPLPTRSDFKRSLRDPRSCILFLPHTKTHSHGQEVVLVDQHPPVNPISLLKNHFRVNNIQGNMPIFSFHSPNGLLLLNKNLFLGRCNTIWSALGYPRTTGHCFRIGGTTELLVAGVPPDIVRITGRWSSESFLRYWRSLDSIAPRHFRYIDTHTRTRTRRRRHI